jgi:hypothetical protein
MGNLFEVVTSLPESGSLVLIGVGLITSAVILRRVVGILTRSNSEPAAKVSKLPAGALRPSERPDQVASV